MQTIYHGYNYDTRTNEGAAQYEGLCAMMKEAGVRCFETWGGGSHYRGDMDGRTVELETKHLFNNQWNTAPIPGISDKGLRVFDWAQDYPINIGKHIKRGHWLTITAEMREARRNTNACGYCGHQERAQKGAVFCPQCIGSEYLKAAELHLTRMQAINAGDKRAELTDAERAHLLPIYKSAQLHGHTERDRKRIAKARADVIARAAARTKNAATERDGFLWWMDRGIRTDNLIFYSHTGRFSFGWRTPVDADFLSGILDIISEFPFPYDITTADGRTLSGG